MTCAAIAIRVRETSEDELKAIVGQSSKQCRGCDPDMPGHAPQEACARCKGTGREPFQFLSVLAELNTPDEESDEDEF
jgi:hypothetical protein